jgi:hypothetical protein
LRSEPVEIALALMPCSPHRRATRSRSTSLADFRDTILMAIGRQRTSRSSSVTLLRFPTARGTIWIEFRPSSSDRERLQDR